MDNGFFFQDENGIRDRSQYLGLGDLYNRQLWYFGCVFVVVCVYACVAVYCGTLVVCLWLCVSMLVWLCTGVRWLGVCGCVCLCVCACVRVGVAVVGSVFYTHLTLSTIHPV